MDLQHILTQLHNERRRVNDVILVLERLAAGLGRRGTMERAAAAISGEAKKKAKAKTKRKKPVASSKAAEA